LARLLGPREELLDEGGGFCGGVVAKLHLRGIRIDPWCTSATPGPPEQPDFWANWLNRGDVPVRSVSVL
jgi:hypothetical protein